MASADIVTSARSIVRQAGVELKAQELDLDGDWRVDDTRLELGRQLTWSPPSTAALDLFFSSENVSTGNNFSGGVKTPLSSDIKSQTAFYVGKGDASVSFPCCTDFSAVFNYGGLSIDTGGKAYLGIIPLNSVPTLESVAVAVAMVLVNTLLEEAGKAGVENIDWEEFGLAFSSNLLIRLLPVNLLRDILQKFGVDTSGDQCVAIETRNQMAGCLIHIASYNKQKLFEVAHDMVAKGLVAPPDPTTQSALMYMHDIIRANERRGGLPPMEAQEDIISNIEAAMADVKRFLDAYGPWLRDGSGQRPSPIRIEGFMGRSLYLLQKLQVSAEINEKTKDIVLGNAAPLIFDHVRDPYDFLQITASAYNAIAGSKALWDFIAVDRKSYVEALSAADGAETPDDFLGLWYRYNNLNAWIDEMTSPSIHALFRVRQLHILKMLRVKFNGSKGFPEGPGLVRKIRLAHPSVMPNRALQMDEAFIETISDQLALKRSALDRASGLIDGMELLSRFAGSGDLLAPWAIGLDFTFTNDTPPLAAGLQVLYKLRTGGWGASEKQPAFVRNMDHLLEQVYERHGKEMRKEIKKYPKKHARKVSDLCDRFENFFIGLNALARLNDAGSSPTRLDRFDKTIAAFAKHSGADGEKPLEIGELQDLVAADRESFKKVVDRTEEILTTELDAFATWIDNGGFTTRKVATRERTGGKVKLTQKELRQRVDLLKKNWTGIKRDFEDLMTYREGAHAMMIFLEEHDARETKPVVSL